MPRQSKTVFICWATNDSGLISVKPTTPLSSGRLSPASCHPTKPTKPALRILGGSDGVEEGPVGFSGVEQRPDPVVGESSEPEGGAFDAFD